MDFGLFRPAVGFAPEWECDVVEHRIWLITIGEEFNILVWVQHLVQENISSLPLDGGRVSGGIFCLIIRETSLSCKYCEICVHGSMSSTLL